MKYGKKELMIGGVAAAAVVAAGIGFFAFKAKDPKTVVVDAFKGVYAAENVNPMEEVFGLKQLYQQFETTGGEVGLEVSIADFAGEDLDMFQGAGITVEAATDIANKRFFENIGISYGGMDVANLHFYGDDTYLMAAVPEFTSKVLTVNYAENLSEQIASSPLMESTGTVLAEEDMEIIDNYISYVTGIYTGEKKPFDLEASWQRYKEGSQAMADFKEAMTVTKTDGAQLMYNGKQQSCNGYHVVIPKEALIGFLKTTYQFFMEDQALKQDFLEYIKVVMDMGNMPYPEAVGEGALTSEEMLANLWTELNTRLDEVFAKLEQILDSGINMEVYVTKKGQLAAMDAAWSFRNEEDVLEMSLKAALEGGSYPIQNSSLTFTAVDSVDTAVVQLHKNGEYTDAVLNSGWTLNAEYSGAVMELTYENAYDRATGDSAVKLLVKDGADVNLEIAMTGVVDELEKGKKLHYIVDSLDVIDNGVTGVSFAGEFYLRELQTEFAAPEGEQMDVLAASLEDWEALLEEVMMNLYSMLMGGSLS